MKPSTWVCVGASDWVTVALETEIVCVYRAVCRVTQLYLGVVLHNVLGDLVQKSGCGTVQYGSAALKIIVRKAGV